VRNAVEVVDIYAMFVVERAKSSIRSSHSMAASSRLGLMQHRWLRLCHLTNSRLVTYCNPQSRSQSKCTGWHLPGD